MVVCRKGAAPCTPVHVRPPWSEGVIVIGHTLAALRDGRGLLRHRAQPERPCGAAGDRIQLGRDKYTGMRTLPLLLASLVATSAASRQSEDASREKWQHVPEVLAALQLEPGRRVADIGGGDGFDTERIARHVGASGRDTAVEISDRALARLKERISRADLSSVQAVLGDVANPRLESGAFDAVLVYHSYHEMTEHRSMVEHRYDALTPGGRLVMVEPDSRQE